MSYPSLPTLDQEVSVNKLLILFPLSSIPSLILQQCLVFKLTHYIFLVTMFFLVYYGESFIEPTIWAKSLFLQHAEICSYSSFLAKCLRQLSPSVDFF